MVKKIKAMADKKKHAGSGLFDSVLAGSVKEQAQQIWLAGMGAFAKAQADGKTVFEALVKEGASLQKKTQTVAEETFGEVGGKVSSMAGEVSAKAGLQWEKLESLFEKRTAKALKKLGVPSSKDVQALQDRIDALTATVAAQSRGPSHGAAKPAATRSAAKLPAKKKAAKSTADATAKTARRKAAAKKATATRPTAA